MRRVARNRPGASGSVYAWARILRYSIWVVVTLVGLDYMGIDITHLALLGGAIGLRYTRVTTNDEVDVIVPNSEFVNGRVVNWTFGSDFRRMHVPFGVAYGSDKEAVKAAGLRAAAAVATTVTDGKRRADVWLVGMGDSSLYFELVVWVGAEATSSPSRVEAAYKWHIHEELIRAGLEIPFPQCDLHIRSGDLRVRLDHGDKGSGVVATLKPRPGA